MLRNNSGSSQSLHGAHLQRFLKAADVSKKIPALEHEGMQRRRAGSRAFITQTRQRGLMSAEPSDISIS